MMLLMKLSITLLTLAAVPPATKDVPISAEQFLRLIHSSHEEIQSISFVFEGENRFVGPVSILEGMNPDKLGKNYQSAFAYRQDGAIVVEGYRESTEFGTESLYNKVSLLRGRFESTDSAPGKSMAEFPVQVRKASPVALPGRRLPPFFFVHLFQDMRSATDLGYEFVGWEVVDGHKCLVVSLDKVPSSINRKVKRSKYWIDMGRGGHPLVMESHIGDDLEEKVFDIQLREYPAKSGSKVWVPVSGKVASFGWERKYYSKPIMTGFATAVNGTVQINVKLADSTFSVAAKTRLPETPELKRLQAKLHDDLAMLTPKTDPESVRVELDRRLAEADQQAVELKASAPARSWPIGTWAFQFAFVVIGAICLAIAFRWGRNR